MSYTVQQAIEDTQRHLHSSQRPELNTLSSDITATTTSIPFTYSAGGIATRALIGVGTEMMYVVAVSGSTATVIRGYNSDAAAHSSGDIIEVNPRFPQAMIVSALRDEIRSWPSGLFSVETVEFSVSSSVSAFNLTGFSADISHILDIRVAPPTGDLTKSWNRLTRWTFTKQANTTDFSSGYSLTFPRDAYFDTRIVASDTRAFRVTAAVEFDVSSLVTSTDLEDGVGLSVSMLDIPPLGAAWRLMTGKEVIRSSIEIQGQPRRAEEVPPGAALQTGQAIKRLRDQRISEEAMRLRRDWPIRGV